MYYTLRVTEMPEDPEINIITVCIEYITSENRVVFRCAWIGAGQIIEKLHPDNKQNYIKSFAGIPMRLPVGITVQWGE